MGLRRTKSSGEGTTLLVSRSLARAGASHWLVPRPGHPRVPRRERDPTTMGGLHAERAARLNKTIFVAFAVLVRRWCLPTPGTDPKFIISAVLRGCSVRAPCRVRGHGEMDATADETRRAVRRGTRRPGFSCWPGWSGWLPALRHALRARPTPNS